MIKGIGPVYAERIVKCFGLDTLEIIDKSPDRLLEVPGIGGKPVEKINACWQEQQSIRYEMIFLRGHGVDPSYAQKIFKSYGDKEVQILEFNSDPNACFNPPYIHSFFKMHRLIQVIDKYINEYLFADEIIKSSL